VIMIRPALGVQQLAATSIACNSAVKSAKVTYMTRFKLLPANLH
jgi:hypothetical protein